MKSPFPGMDPYLETRWGDVHSRLNIYASDIISQSLPPGLLARSEERAIVSDPIGGWDRDIYPDVSLFERGLSEPSVVGGGVDLAESQCLVLPELVEIKQRYLEIRDARSGGQVITVIEFISPSNKQPGDGLDKYLQKQRECIDGDINLVEIDLTRSGSRKLVMPIEKLQPEHLPTYAALVRRAGIRQRVWFYQLPLRKRLGGIPIPLRKTDRDIVLDLQALIDQIYVNGRYGDDLTYRESLHPPLSDDDATWAAPLIATCGLKASATN